MRFKMVKLLKLNIKMNHHPSSIVTSLLVERGKKYNLRVGVGGGGYYITRYEYCDIFVVFKNYLFVFGNLNAFCT